MNFIPSEFYHVYNRGNNKQPIFFCEDNYHFFLEKVEKQLKPLSGIIAYCLMPNHFHFLIQATYKSIKERTTFGGKPMQELAYRIGILLSSYSQAVNKQNGTTGSLFQQKTKAKILDEGVNTSRASYLQNCFAYIHRNPVVSGLVKRLPDWHFSSYQDYIGLRAGTLCNKDIFYRHTGFCQNDIARICSLNLEGDETEGLF